MRYPRLSRRTLFAGALFTVLLFATALLFFFGRTTVRLEGNGLSEEVRNSLSTVLFGSKRNGGSAFREADRAASVTVSVNSFHFGSREANLTMYSESGAPLPAFFVLRRVHYVPAVGPTSEKTDISLEECALPGLEIVRLSELAEGSLAMTVGGLTVADEDYPLVIESIAVVVQTREGSAAEKAFAETCRQLQALEDALPADPAILWVAAVGDIMLARGAAERLASGGAAEVFSGVQDILKEADLTVGNLEGAISRRGTAAKKSYTFRYAPSVAADLSLAGFDALLLANNHAFDWGREAFEDTLTNLKAAGIAPLGGGLNSSSAAEPFHLVTAAGTVRSWGLASYPREKNGWDSSLAAASVEQSGILRAADGGNLAIVSGFSSDVLDLVFFHGGEEWSTRPDPETRSLYYSMIDAGADAVFGSHPHVVQGFEMYKGKPVFWSLGNFLFPGMDGTPGGEEGLLTRCGFLMERLLYLQPKALTVKGTRVQAAPESALKTFYSRSRALQ